MKAKVELEEYKSLLLGRKLGEGVDRQVYVFRPDPKCVIKVQDGTNAHQNFLEWEAFSILAGTKMERWLAPCYKISDCGHLLVQARVEPIPFDLLPTKLPDFMHEDLKQNSVGMLDGRIVMCDYGYLSMRLRDSSIRMKKVNW